MAGVRPKERGADLDSGFVATIESEVKIATYMRVWWNWYTHRS